MTGPVGLFQAQVYPAWHTLLTVDLRLPDALLTEQFLTWLMRIRREAGIQPPKRLNRTQFSHWIKHGILPYLDLKLWGFLEKKTISNRVLSESIFTRPGSEENVRKTTAPLAEQLTSISSPIFLQLRAQAAQAAAESFVP
jgi:hypothetical protein